MKLLIMNMMLLLLAPVARGARRVWVRGKGFKDGDLVQSISNALPHFAAQGGISAALANMGDDDWRYTCMTRLKGQLARRSGCD